MEESFILFAAETAATPTPEANPCLKVIQIIVASNKSHKAPELKTGQFINITSFSRVRLEVKLFGHRGYKRPPPLVTPQFEALGPN